MNTTKGNGILHASTHVSQLAIAIELHGDYHNRGYHTNYHILSLLVHLWFISVHLGSFELAWNLSEFFLLSFCIFAFLSFCHCEVALTT